MRNKVFLIFLMFFIIIFSVGCNSRKEEKKIQKVEENKIDTKKELLIYTSFFPVEEFTNKIVGDKFKVKSIINYTKPPHGFELTSNMLKEISKADLIIYNGANMEEFINDLKAVVKDEKKFLNLSQGLTLLKSGELKTDENVNPHTWLSIKNAIIQLDTIYKKISSLDPKNESYYKNNFDKAKKEFIKLDKKFEKELSEVKDKNKYFVVSHAAFNYLANDYGLKQVAVTGLSPEDEPSAKKLKTISDFVKKNKISTIFFEGKATPKVAETLARETKVKTSILYTMEVLTEKEKNLGYIELMKINLNNLIKSFKDEK